MTEVTNVNFEVRIGEEFEGPLPKLLEMVEKRQLSISRVSLATVADDFLQYVRNLPTPSMGELAEFLMIASTLMLIKSSSLLPALQLSPTETEEIDDLERRLKIYQIISATAARLRQDIGRRTIFYPQARHNQTIIFSPSAEVTAGNLLTAFTQLIAALPPELLALPQVAVKKSINLEEVVNNLTERVERALKLNFSEYIKGQSADWQKEKTNIIVSFLAVLELCKRGLVEAEQGNHFDEIRLATTQPNVPRY